MTCSWPEKSRFVYTRCMLAVGQTQMEGERQHACSTWQPAEESHLLGVTEGAKVLQALYNGGVKRLHRSRPFGKQPPAQSTEGLSDPSAGQLQHILSIGTHAARTKAGRGKCSQGSDVKTRISMQGKLCCVPYISAYSNGCKNCRAKWTFCSLSLHCTQQSCKKAA